MKKTMKQYSFASRLKSLALVLGIALAFASCANEDIAQNPNGTNNNKNFTIFSTGDPATRTSMERNGAFYWEAGDKIWVKDDNGTWQQSRNAPTEKTASFKFEVPGKFTKTTTYKVYYPGQNGNQNQVTIAANQSQAEPNTTAHFGTSGDCGMADAAWSNAKNGFAFTLDHKAAYLLFLPRTSNTILHDCYLTKVEVNSDNDITSTYTLNPVTGKLTGTGSGNQIVVATVGSGTYANGFPLTNNATSAATNGAYVVIKPGTHTLKVRYWVKDVATHVEGTITKTLASATYDQNKYYDITANLDIKNYDGDHYYMWDAQEQYWKGYEWTKHLASGAGQPTLNGNSSSNYAQSNTDSRYYNEAFTYGVDNPATHTPCKDLPNVNEMTWYAAKGDPRWDGDELWTTMGHLYKGGMWLKEKSVLQGEGNYNSNTAVDGTDWRTNGNAYSWSISQTLPSVADAANYFYLPALGLYNFGQLNDVGNGRYWSSSAHPWYSNFACYLDFSSGQVRVSYNDRSRGFRVGGFK
ncbi:hypothetical protein HMPREF9969_1371 [Prevotella sp. oral taxon 306 str. F0472]|uniref:hypothetical protein n=1 Tax=Prevotella sp. oral taxon 306 TaxID=712461 RepID=UPI00025BBE7D|nr:hypothetical protein [Prevotella sp. oral taxon 306]EID33490.1 hypothetical protein HMPREF9969_1371 [Prevotella sp. oral taxon 306 str. F0472]